VANNPLNAVDPLGLLLSDCVSCNFFNNALSAVNQTINWSAEAQTRAFFGDRYYDLPGHSNPIQQALGRYIAQVNLAFAQANAGRNADPAELHLNLESDCALGKGTRNIVYSLDDPAGDTVSGFYVTEHQTDTSLANGPEGPGTSTQGPNPYGLSGFNDLIGGLGFHDSLQTFTVSRNKPGKGGLNYGTFVRNPSGDYGTLRIYIKGGVVYVNGDASEPVCQ